MESCWCVYQNLAARPVRIRRTTRNLLDLQIAPASRHRSSPLVLFRRIGEKKAPNDIFRRREWRPDLSYSSAQPTGMTAVLLEAKWKSLMPATTECFFWQRSNSGGISLLPSSTRAIYIFRCSCWIRVDALLVQSVEDSQVLIAPTRP